MSSEYDQTKLPTAPPSIQRYLAEIADRLFSGHAALMVGAGFSKNARPISTLVPQFPDWSDLGCEFYKKLHGQKPSASINCLNVPRLAEEVEAEFGRSAVEKILREIIPDRLYDPSLLHIRLLDLPWSDAFTTNYDTLLDRATSSVISQKYDLVINKRDLIYSERPRLIKLHGSFRSERSLIITEDDYRRYPTECAPFVNTVRQSLLENILCLIGFSGDDPNFQEWTGWIRDNIGCDDGPKIYLLGIPNLSTPTQKFLDRRNITLVDLTDFLDIGGGHQSVLEKFLDYLELYRKENSVNQWPSRCRVLTPEVHQEDNLLELLDYWKNDRINYPGWIILPHDRRLRLWDFIERRLNLPERIRTSDDLPPLADLELAFELLWRLELCLCPILDDQISFFENVAVRYLPLVNNKNSVPEPTSEYHEQMSKRGLDQQDVCNKCMYIFISVLRYFREKNDSKKWANISSIIENNRINLSVENQARFSYEKALKSLFELDLSRLDRQISSWTVDESMPFWLMKKAGLLAEIGRLDEASVILKGSLDTVRRMLNLKPIKSNYALVSLESYIMVHLRYVRLANNFIQDNWTALQELQEPRNQDSKRWNILKQYECEPWDELRIFRLTLDRLHEEQPPVTEERNFDIGSITKTTHFDYQNREVRFAFSFLRFCEEIGIPFQISGCDIASRAAKGALNCISEWGINWAIVTLLRVGDNRAIDSVFNRRFISKMSISDVDNLVAHLVRTLRNIDKEDTAFQRRLAPDVLSEGLTSVVPEIVSRLCCKCSLDSLRLIGEFLIDVYTVGEKGGFQGIRNLTRRFVTAWPRQHFEDLTWLLMRFPVLSNRQRPNKSEFTNPFLYLSIKEQQKLPRGSRTIEIGERHWSFCVSNDPKVREWAVTTLIRLYYRGLLSLEDKRRFSEVLWSQLDDDGLPANTGLYRFRFLELPSPNGIDRIGSFRKYLNRTIRSRSDNENKVQRDDLHIIGIEIVGASNHLKWKKAEFKDIVDYVIEFWNVSKKDSPRTKLFRAVLGNNATQTPVIREKSRSVKLLSSVIIESIFRHPNRRLVADHRESIKRVIDEIEEANGPMLELRASSLHFFQDYGNTLFDEVRYALVSDDRDRIEDGLDAIRRVIRSYNLQPFEEFDNLSGSVSLPFEMIAWSSVESIGLPRALSCVNSILQNESGLVDRRLSEMVLMTLERIADWSDLLDDRAADEKLEVRLEAASLAFLLYSQYKSQGVRIPEVLSRWKSTCKRDEEFAEIRNSWFPC